MIREIEINGMPENGYISWIVTTQNAVDTKVKLKDAFGNTCFSAQKKKALDTSIDPPLALGSGFIKGSQLKLTIEASTSNELKGTPKQYAINNEKGEPVGENFSIALEDYIDDDYNDIYINIVGWVNKG